MRALRRLWAALRRRPMDERLEEEIGFHLAMEEEENRRRGLPPDEARRAAERAFGSVLSAKDAHRDARGLPWLEDAIGDVRLALRSIRRTPLFATAVIVLVALGIGANTAVYTVVDGILLRPLPYPRPAELIQLQRVDPGDSGVGQDGPTVEGLRAGADDDLRIAAVGWSIGLNLVDGDVAVHVRAQPASFEYFGVMGVPPLTGRRFEAADEHPGSAPVAILGYELAQRLGGETAAVGRRVLLGGQPHAVVGVMPRGFRTFPRVDLLVPFRPGADAGGTNFLVLARTQKSRDAAQARLDAITAALRESGHLSPETSLRWTGLHEGMAWFRRPALLLLLGAVGLVLLIACANVAGLLLVRAQGRGAEMAVRAALGGGRGRLVRQLLSESVVYALLGGALGVVVAHVALDLLLGLGPPDLADWRLALDGRVLAFSLALTVVTGVVFGLLPAFRASRVDVRSALVGASGVAAQAPRAGWRRGLLAGELALCTMLLLGAGLLVRTVLALRAVDLGYRPDSVLALAMSPDPDSGGGPGVLPSAYARALERAREVPGLERVVLAGGIPGRRGLNLPIRVPGKGEVEAVGWRYVTPGYFELLGIPVRRGRALADRDGSAAPAVMVVNDAFARRYFADGDALGREIQLHNFADVPRTIVGVVGDTRDGSLVRDPEPTIYVAVAQVPAGLFAISHRFFDASWLVRTNLPPSVAAERLGSALRTVWPGLPFSEVASLRDVVEGHLVTEKFLTTLIATFALVSLCIALTGIYGVTAYSVSRRSREIGIRMALGAAPGTIMRSVIGEGLVAASIGIAVGLAAAWPLGPLLGHFLYGVAAFDPVTMALVVGVLLLAAALACAAPARRAARIDPVANLRQG